MTADPKTIPSRTASQSEELPAAALREDHFAGVAVQAPQPTTAADGWRIWLWRLRALLYVTLCATFGVLLLILPWTPKWTDNPLLLASPGLREFVSSGFVRGFCSGLGLLDLWLGFREAILYHDNPNSTDH